MSNISSLTVQYYTNYSSEETLRGFDLSNVVYPILHWPRNNIVLEAMYVSKVRHECEEVEMEIR